MGLCRTGEGTGYLKGKGEETRIGFDGDYGMDLGDGT